MIKPTKYFKVTIMPIVHYKNVDLKSATVPNNIGIHLYNIYINNNKTIFSLPAGFYNICFLSALLSLLTLCLKNPFKTHLNTENLCHFVWHFKQSFGTLTLKKL